MSSPIRSGSTRSSDTAGCDGLAARIGPAGRRRDGLQDPDRDLLARPAGTLRPNATAHGRPSTPASAVTSWTGCSPGPCSRSKPAQTRPATSTGSSRSTPPSSAPINMPQPPAEKWAPAAGRTGRSRPRPIPRRSDHQNSPRLRWSRAATGDPGETWPTPRQHLRTPPPGTHPGPAHGSGPSTLQARPRHRGQGFQSIEGLSRLPWEKCCVGLMTREKTPCRPASSGPPVSARHPQRRHHPREGRGSSVCLAIRTKASRCHGTAVRSCSCAVHTFRAPSATRIGAVKRAGRRAASDRWCSWGRGLSEEAEQHQVPAAGATRRLQHEARHTRAEDGGCSVRSRWWALSQGTCSGRQLSAA
ncbi:hypothetical protein SAURM35S_03122 [Streptomyces aurantiogriseus]